MPETHSVTFEWPHSGAKTVVVTGTFDQWSSSTKLSAEGSKFTATVQVPWNEKVAYKFIVDGKWLVNEKEPTELDKAGNLNNVYFSPAKPVEEVAKPVKQDQVVAEIPPESKPTEVDSQADGVLPKIINTVSATEGTSGTLSYIASGVGAAIQSVLGVDPINPAQQAPPETPNSEGPASSSAPLTNINESQGTTSSVLASAYVAGTKREAEGTPLINRTESPEEPFTKNAGPLPVLPLNVAEPTQSVPQSSSEDRPSTHVPAPSTPESVSGTTTTTKIPLTDAPASTIATTNGTATSVPSATTPESKLTPSGPDPTSHSSLLMERETAVSPAVLQTPSNGSKVAESVTPTASRSTSPAPSTPTKKHQRFPSAARTASPTLSDKEKSPSRFKTGSRSIGKSLAGLRRVSIKGIFGGSKDKEDK